MSKVTLIEKIKQKGLEEAALIRQKGQEEAQSLYQKMLDDANHRFDALLVKTERKQQATIDTKKQSIERALRDEKAMAKQKLIEQVFAEIKSYLINLKGKDLFNYIKHSISKETIQGDEIIMVSKHDYETYLSILSTKKGNLVECDLLNKELGTQLKLSKEPASIESGFIVVGKIFDLNFSYEETIDRLTTAYEKQIYEEMV
jgi:V/A-type H+-transporting ATPase subunit E